MMKRQTNRWVRIGILWGGLSASAWADNLPSFSPPTPQFVKWRHGATGSPIDWTGQPLVFSYLASPGTPFPTRANPKDNSANNENCLWSDNAIYLNFSWPTPRDTSYAILIYTDNKANGPSDPLNTVSLRGGLVGGAGGGNPNDPNRASVFRCFGNLYPRRISGCKAPRPWMESPRSPPAASS